MNPFAVLSLAAITVSFGATDLANAGESKKIDSESARAIVMAWVFEVKPEMNPEIRLEIQEIADADLWSSLGAQLFAKTEESFAILPSHFLIKGSKVYPVGSFGPPFSWCVSDLDRDGLDDFVYSAVYGSGWARSRVHALISSPGGFSPCTPSQSLNEREIVLSCEPNGTVWVAAAKLWSTQQSGAPVRFGRIAIEEKGSQPRIRIDVDPSAPEEIHKDLRE